MIRSVLEASDQKLAKTDALHKLSSYERKRVKRTLSGTEDATIMVQKDKPVSSSLIIA